MNGPNIKEIKKRIKDLNIPKDYWGIDIDSFFAHQWNIYTSIRETAGKTTQALIFGLVLNAVHPDHYVIEYLRNDSSQIVKGNIETLFKTVISFGYLKKIFKGRWNDIEYKSMTHKFFLCNRDEDGAIIEEDSEPICIVHAVEKWADMKSSYNNPRGNYIVLDEYPDTSRATYRIFKELLHTVSTIGRPLSEQRQPWLHILLIGNNTDEYCFYYDEFFENSDDIRNLKFGGSVEFKTEYNTNGIAKLLELGETQKKRLSDKNIPFLGFPGKKAAEFTGATEWSGKTYRHPDFDLNYEYCLTRRLYMYHRGRYIQMDLFNDPERGSFLFFHFAKEPQKDDNIIFCLDPEKPFEIYGFGKYDRREKISKICKKIQIAIAENRTYFASNMVGSLLDDFIKNI